MRSRSSIPRFWSRCTTSSERHTRGFIRSHSGPTKLPSAVRPGLGISFTNSSTASRACPRSGWAFTVAPPAGCATRSSEWRRALSSAPFPATARFFNAPRENSICTSPSRPSSPIRSRSTRSGSSQPPTRISFLTTPPPKSSSEKESPARKSASPDFPSRSSLRSRPLIPARFHPPTAFGRFSTWSTPRATRR